MDFVAELTAQMMNRYTSDLERMCEIMLTTPEGWGVRVDWADTLSYRITLSPEVPFGMIHEHHHFG